MAKKATAPKPAVAATGAAPATSNASAIAADVAQMQAGKLPYTLLHGTHRDVSDKGGNNPPDETVYKQGDVIYSDRPLDEIFPDRFVKGRTAVAANGVIKSTPGLGLKITDEIQTYGYDVYAKDGAVYAYTPGDYSEPKSPALVDLQAAEEWCMDNAIETPAG